MSSWRFSRSASFSRTSSRRSNAKIPLILILLLLPSVYANAQQARLDATLRAGKVYGSVEYLSSHTQEVLASLREGLRAEVTFQFRLYRRNRGIFSFLGDRLLLERRVYQTAAFDFYENRYKIKRDGDDLGEYAGETEFLDAFFSLPEIELGEIEAADTGEYYLLARGRMMPVKIIAPLNIITLFSSETAFTTPWVEAELEP
jgi:hypothetical protein